MSAIHQMSRYLKQSSIQLRTVMTIAVIVFIWMLSGIFRPKHHITDTVVSTTILQPKTMSSVAMIKTKYMMFSATSSANESVLLLPQVGGQIVRKFVDSGARLKKGDKILQIENATLKERVEQMHDNLNTAITRYQSVLELNKNGLSSKLELSEAKTDLNAAETELIAAKTALDNSFVVAPFDGYMDNVLLQEGDVISGFSPKPVGMFTNRENILVKAYVSQKDRNIIKDSSEALIAKTSHQTMPAKITFVSNVADSNTGAFLVEATAQNIFNIVTGETVHLMVKVGDFESHKIPISALIINKNGDLAVKVVEQNLQAKIYKINVVDEDEDSLWVTGLPQECEIIVAGQSYIY